MTAREITLRQTRDALGSRYLGVTLAADGAVSIIGQDLGDGVEQFYGDGFREYEWAWTIAAEDVPALLDALGGGGDVLDALQARFSGDHAGRLGPFLDDNGIPYERWSRVGD